MSNHSLPVNLFINHHHNFSPQYFFLLLYKMILNKKIAVLIISLIIAFAAKAQNIKTVITYTNSIADSRYIVYIPSQKLTIEDFTGKPDAGNDAVAITSSGFLFKAGYRNKAGKATLLISVYCNFDKQLSWMKESGKNDYILGHEQYHFDISYISTLLFIKKLKQTNFTNSKYMQQLEAVYNDAIKNMEQLQNHYDTETNNGLQKDKQEIWNKKIDKELTILLNE